MTTKMREKSGRGSRDGGEEEERLKKVKQKIVSVSFIFMLSKIWGCSIKIILSMAKSFERYHTEESKSPTGKNFLAVIIKLKTLMVH